MNTIRKLKNIKACDQAKEFVYLHREQIKNSSLPLTVVAAVLFFWFFSLHEEPASKEAQPAGEGGEQTQTCIRRPGDGGAGSQDLCGHQRLRERAGRFTRFRKGRESFS